MFESSGELMVVGEIERGAAAEVEDQLMSHSSQLTLSFQGEVYVFDSVQPERVQAVLLLLGGQELPCEVAGMTQPDNVNHRLSHDIPRSFSNSQRLASVMRYREKRKKLCFDKKVLYEVRKDVALRMKRCRGQFASSKTNSEELFSPSSCQAAQSNSQEETVSSFCQHCGTSKDSTPMMRRGPAGPRSLCNACGLMWANKGAFRNLPNSSTAGIRNSINLIEQGDANESDIGSNGDMSSATSNGHESVMISGIDASMGYVDG